MRSGPGPVLLALALAAAPVLAGDASSVYRKDVQFLLDELEKRAGHFFERKKVDWKAVRARFTKEVATVADDAAHVRLCARLMARLEDGHAGIVESKVAAPSAEKKGVGLSLAVQGKTVLIKDCWGLARQGGLKSGWEVRSIDGTPALQWLDRRVAALRDLRGYSTDHAALFSACHHGMADAPGTRFAFELRRPDGGTLSRTLTCGTGGGNGVPIGPIHAPADLKNVGRQGWAPLGKKLGYIHLRDVPGELPRQIDEMMAGLGRIEGLVLDLRANGGGGVDHAEVFARFLPNGASLGNHRGVSPAGFGGAIVVIVDGGTVSAGETIAGMFQEEGRARLIGPSPTAGMSGSKETLAVPSGLLTVRFTVRSHRAGRGRPEIEGVGVAPDELVAFDGKAMEAGVDPFIRRATELLQGGAVQPPRYR